MKFILQIITGLEFLEISNIRYLNIRSENIFIKNDSIKLFINYNWWTI